MLKSDSTEKLWKLLDTLCTEVSYCEDCKKECNIRPIKSELENLDSEIKDTLEEYEKWEKLYNDSEDRVEYLEEEVEALEEKQCESHEDCPFNDCQMPDIKSLGDASKFNTLINNFNESQSCQP